MFFFLILAPLAVVLHRPDRAGGERVCVHRPAQPLRLAATVLLMTGDHTSVGAEVDVSLRKCFSDWHLLNIPKFQTLCNSV